MRLAELAGSFRQRLMAFAVGVGMHVVDAILAEGVVAIAGAKGKHDPMRVAARRDNQPSSLPLGGRRVSFERPRVRTTDGREVRLPSWEALQAADQAARDHVNRMLAGVSTRDYAPALEPIGDLDSSSASRSSVLRRFVAKAAARRLWRSAPRICRGSRSARSSATASRRAITRSWRSWAWITREESILWGSAGHSSRGTSSPALLAPYHSARSGDRLPLGNPSRTRPLEVLTKESKRA